jgi:hypothetical protein
VRWACLRYKNFQGIKAALPGIWRWREGTLRLLVHWRADGRATGWGNNSRMTEGCQIRFCKSLGLQLPRPVDLLQEESLT